MSTLFQDLRYGARMLLKTPAITFIVILALALGIGANTAIFSVLNAVVLRPLPFANAEQLTMIWEQNPQRGWYHNIVSTANFNDWRKQNQVTAGVVDSASADRQSEHVFVKPKAVVDHETQETLLRPDLALAIHHVNRITRAADATAVFATCIAGKGKCHFVQRSVRMVVVLHLNAVVRVIANATWDTESVGTQRILIA